MYNYIKGRGVNTLISMDPSMDAVTQCVKKLGFSIVETARSN